MCAEVMAVRTPTGEITGKELYAMGDVGLCELVEMWWKSYVSTFP